MEAPVGEMPTDVAHEAGEEKEGEPFEGVKELVKHGSPQFLRGRPPAVSRSMTTRPRTAKSRKPPRKAAKIGTPSRALIVSSSRPRTARKKPSIRAS